MAADLEITRLMNNARTRLSGATEDNLQRELFMVMDEFMKETNVWQEDIPITIPGQEPPGTVYIIAPNEPANITQLMWVYTPSDSSLRGSPVAASMQVMGEMILRNQPSSDQPLIVTVALTVQDPVNRDGYVVFPTWIAQRYGDAILDGLLGRMMTQPNKPWTNNQMSVYHLRKFNAKKAQTRVEVTRNNVFRAQAWSFPGFAGGSQKGRSSGWAPPQ
jgi:hypothetical protein